MSQKVWPCWSCCFTERCLCWETQTEASRLCVMRHFKLVLTLNWKPQETSLRCWELWGRCPHRDKWRQCHYVKGRKWPRKRYSVNLCEVIYLHVCHTETKVDPSGRVNEIPAFPVFFSFPWKKEKDKTVKWTKPCFSLKMDLIRVMSRTHPSSSSSGKASEMFEDIMKYSRVSCSALSQHVFTAWSSCTDSLRKMFPCISLWFHSAGDDVTESQVFSHLHHVTFL